MRDRESTAAGVVQRMIGGQAAHSRYALNLSLSLATLHPEDRMEFAASFGFENVEMWWPFPTPDPSTRQIGELRGALQSAGARLVCLNIDAGDFEAGDRGLLADPLQRERCRTSIVAAVRTAAATGCRLVNMPYGNAIPAATAQEQHRTAWANLRFAAEHASAVGVSVLLEPLNAKDNPDYLLSDLATAAEIVRRARQMGHENVGILLDVYHLARTVQDVEGAIARYASGVLHVQFADLPDRGCPGTGELDFASILRMLADGGYEGFVGLEFMAKGEPDEALRDAQRFVAKYPALPNFG